MTKSKSVPAALMFLLAVASLAGDATAQKKEKPAPKPKPVMVAVVQLDGEYQIVAKDEVAAMKKRLVQEHKDAVAAHKAAKAEAKKNKEKFDDPTPKPKKLKVIKASVEESKAQALVASLKDKDAKKAAGKSKPTAKPKGKPKKGPKGG